MQFAQVAAVVGFSVSYVYVYVYKFYKFLLVTDSHTKQRILQVMHQLQFLLINKC